MFQALNGRHATSNTGLVLAMAASMGIHAAVVWGAGWLVQPSWRLKPIHVISLRIVDDGPPAYARLKTKAAESVRRSAPPANQMSEPLTKVLIVQKPIIFKEPLEPPHPTSNREGEALRLEASLVDFQTRAAKDEKLSLKGPTEGMSSSEAPSLSEQGSFAVAKAETRSSEDRASRLEAIRMRIQEALAYPKAARRFGWEGTARVRLVLSRDGWVYALELESSSQMAVLDQEALAAVRRAAPYPYVEGAIIVPIVFDLRSPGR